MQQCPTCRRSDLAYEHPATHAYTASGLDNVTLYGITIARCTCGQELCLIPRIDELRRKIAVALVSKLVRTQAEITFLQKWLEGEAFEPTPPVQDPMPVMIKAKATKDAWHIEVEIV